MIRILTWSAGLLIVCQVLAAPSGKQPSNEVDSVEQELIRHHHSTSADKSSPTAGHNEATADDSDGEDDQSVVKGFEDIDSESEGDDEAITEDDLYDITVGDVIRDVLLTLRDHPEIVRELIQSEKAKLTAQIAAFNSLVESKESSGDTLAGFLQPSDQLNTQSKSIEKKTGRSGMPAAPDRQLEEKRRDEVAVEPYTPDSGGEEFGEFGDFLQKLQEGGKDDPMFNYEKAGPASDNSHSAQSETDKQEKSSSEGSSKSSADLETDSSQPHLPFRLPFLNPYKTFNPYQTSGQSEKESDVKSKVTSENSDSQDLAWILRKGHENQEQQKE